MGPSPTSFASISELEATAVTKIPPGIREYIQGGAGEERTLASNVEAFRRRALRPRVLRGVREVDVRTTLLGAAVRFPGYIAPMAYQGDIVPEGEAATARAAASAGWLSLFSTLSSRSLEEIASAAPGGPRGFQLYLQPEFEASARLVERAEAAGYRAVVLTVDAPIFSVRDRQRAGGFAVDGRRPLGNGPGLLPPARSPTPDGGKYRLREDGAQTWDVVDRLREVTDLPIVVKGVLHPDDATLAVEHGARAVIVSNHGGRQLDGAMPAIDALPEVVRAVGGRAEVYVEGGVRRAVDVVIALALGARAVGIGRPVLWALAVGGADGVLAYLRLLEEELVNVMVLIGSESLSGIGPELLA